MVASHLGDIYDCMDSYISLFHKPSVLVVSPVKSACCLAVYATACLCLSPASLRLCLGFGCLYHFFHHAMQLCMQTVGINMLTFYPP